MLNLNVNLKIENNIKLDVYKSGKKQFHNKKKKKTINLNEIKFTKEYSPIFESKKNENRLEFMNYKIHEKEKESLYKLAKNKFLKKMNRIKIYEQHQSVAIVTNSVNDIEASYNRMLNLKNLFRFPPQKIKYLVIHGGGLEEFSDKDDCYNFFHYKSFNEFDLIILDAIKIVKNYG